MLRPLDAIHSTHSILYSQRPGATLECKNCNATDAGDDKRLHYACVPIVKQDLKISPVTIKTREEITISFNAGEEVCPFNLSIVRELNSTHFEFQLRSDDDLFLAVIPVKLFESLITRLACEQPVE